MCLSYKKQQGERKRLPWGGKTAEAVLSPKGLLVYQGKDTAKQKLIVLRFKTVRNYVNARLSITY